MSTHLKIGILGSDERSVAFGKLLASGGARVAFADPASRARAEAAARELHAEVGTPYHVAAVCDLLVFAGDRGATDTLLATIGSIPATATVVDAMPRSQGSGGGALLLAHKLDTHRVVRAVVQVPRRGAQIALCGDDPEAKAAVGDLFRASGCRVEDSGGLAAAEKIEVPQGGHAA